MKTQHQEWLEDQVGRAVHTAQKDGGLAGSQYRVSLFSTAGRIFDGNVDIDGGLKTNIKLATEYPNLCGPAILRISDMEDSAAFEVGLTPPSVPNGVFIKKEPARGAVAAGY